MNSDAVKIRDAFWGPRMRVWDCITVYDVLDKLEGHYEPDRKDLIEEKAGIGRTLNALLNFDRVAKGHRNIGIHDGPPWYDGLLAGSPYKVWIRETAVKRTSQNHITVDAAEVRNSIPQTMFGTCMEDVNHEIYGGIYAQLIMGESFEEPASGVNFNEWKKFGGFWAADHEYGDSSVSIIPGRHTRRMVGKKRNVHFLLVRLL